MTRLVNINMIKVWGEKGFSCGGDWSFQIQETFLVGSFLCMI